jgi:hypothetical protein
MLAARRSAKPMTYLFGAVARIKFIGPATPLSRQVISTTARAGAPLNLDVGTPAPCSSTAMDILGQRKRIGQSALTSIKVRASGAKYREES